MHVKIVIPTHNRASLAAAALESVLDQPVENVSVIVSDNSTDVEEREWLAAHVRRLGHPGVAYVAPPDALSMTGHWAWALDQALADPSATHVVYLTDRMVFRRNVLRLLLGILAADPERVLSYNHDELVDFKTPVGLLQHQWTDWLLELAAQHLLDLGIRGEFPHALPRMLNSIVPRTVIQSVYRRFGSVFASIAPDYCFAFRCLDTVESIRYWDASPIVHYAQARSHGYVYTRGLESRDREDFVASLAGGPMHPSTPMPDIEVVTNSIFNEYFFVQAEPASRRLKPVPRSAYLCALATGLSQIEDPTSRSSAFDLLATRGWQWSGARGRGAARRWSLLARFFLRRPSTLLRRGMGMWKRTSFGRAALRLAVSRGAPPPAGAWLTFGDQCEGIERARVTWPARAHDLAHVPNLVEPPGAARVLRSHVL